LEFNTLKIPKPMKRIWTLVALAIFGLSLQQCSNAPKMSACMGLQMVEMGFESFKGTELEMECIQLYKSLQPEGDINPGSMRSAFLEAVQKDGFRTGNVSPIDYELKQGMVSCIPCAEKEEMTSILGYLYDLVGSKVQSASQRANGITDGKGSDLTADVSPLEDFGEPNQNFDGSAHRLDALKGQVVPMGWSENGLFAYRYTTPALGSCGQSDYVYVVSLKSDKVVSTPFADKCFTQKGSGGLNWATGADGITKELEKKGIRPMSHFPMSNQLEAVNSKGEVFPLSFNVLKIAGGKLGLSGDQYGTEYSITATFNGETKTLTKSKVVGDAEYVGYFQNPLEDRIAILVRVKGWDSNGNRVEEYQVVGCHLDGVSFEDPNVISFEGVLGAEGMYDGSHSTELKVKSGRLAGKTITVYIQTSFMDKSRVATQGNVSLDGSSQYEGLYVKGVLIMNTGIFEDYSGDNNHTRSKVYRFKELYRQ
jgi:hypothetical protein